MIIINCFLAYREPTLFSLGEKRAEIVGLFQDTLPRKSRISEFRTQNCTDFTYRLRTDSYVNFREYCKQFEINTARQFCRKYLLSDTLNIESRKHNLTYSLRFYFYQLNLEGFSIYHVSCQINRKDQTSPKLPAVTGTRELAVGPS